MDALTGPRLTALVAALPATVPFVGPETQKRARLPVSSPPNCRHRWRLRVRVPDPLEQPV